LRFKGLKSARLLPDLQACAYIGESWLNVQQSVLPRADQKEQHHIVHLLLNFLSPWDLFGVSLER